MSLSRPRRGREEEGGGGGDGRAGGDEGRRESTPGKRPRRCSCSCCQETRDFYECHMEILKKEMAVQRMPKGSIEDIKNQQREMQEFYQNSQLQLEEKICERMEQRMEKICERMEQRIREQINTVISELSTLGDTHLRNYSSLRAISNQNQSRTYRLRFENKCCNDKYSRHDITADDGSPIKVAIYDHDNRIITDGPLSSMQVKIVVLNGEFNNDNKEQWSEDSFQRNIIHARPGKLPLFSNEVYLRLKNGVAILSGVKFQDNSSFVPSKKFRMGVMAADVCISEKIMEGISESFSVKDGRGFSKKKDPHPSLIDPIHKLRKIAENGDRHKHLERMQIKLVGDFVRFYKKDKDGLRKACGNISDHDWDIIVKHALSCKPGHERYSYHIPAKDATIFFNSVYDIIGATFIDKYSSYEELDNAQKGLVEASKREAYDNLTVVLREDKISQQGKGLESSPAQESPSPRQRWMKIVITVTTVQFWNKKLSTGIGITETFDNFYTAPLTENGPGMADTFIRSQVEPGTSDAWDCLPDVIFKDDEDLSFILFSPGF